MTGSADGEHGSYPELVDALTRHGANAKADAAALYRRMVFNVLVSNVDDHLRITDSCGSARTGGRCLPLTISIRPQPT